jgi:hypothetical protein
LDAGVEYPPVTLAALHIADWIVEYFYILLLPLVGVVTVDGLVLPRFRTESACRRVVVDWSVLMRLVPCGLNWLSIAAVWAPVIRAGKCALNANRGSLA